MTDEEITDGLAQLASIEVPRQTDLGAVHEIGARRLRRRRAGLLTTAAGVAAVPVLAVMAVSGVVPPHQPATLPAGGSGHVVRPPDRSQVSTPAPATAGGTYPWAAKFASAATHILHTGDRWAGDGQATRFGSVWHIPAIRGGGLGYASFNGTTDPRRVAAAKADPCGLRLHPFRGVGRTCRAAADNRGRYWVMTFQDSNQGRTVIFRVISDRAVVEVTQSTGFPSYRLFGPRYPQVPPRSPYLLPWDGRDGLNPEPLHPFRFYADPPTRQRLESLPMTAGQQLRLARQQLAAAPH